MALRRKPKKDPEATESPPLPEDEEITQTKKAPAPLNRAMPSPEPETSNTGLIRVRANRAIGELDEQGRMQRYAKGDVFWIDAARARALGPQVTETK